jgi:hypothetical protein
MICRILFLISVYSFAAYGQKIPCAHSHNDYLRSRPFAEAFHLGFGSIEADIFLSGSNLLVGHEEENLTKEKTLESMYIKSIADIAKKNNGKLPGYEKPLILLIDIKTEALPTYQALVKLLNKYKYLFTRFYGDTTDERLVTVVISGNRPVEYMEKEPYRLAALDGRLDDLDRHYRDNFMQMVSAPVTMFGAEEELRKFNNTAVNKIKLAVEKCKSQNKKLRLWGVPDGEKFWMAQFEMGLGFIGTDSPGLFSEFFTKEFK